MTQATQNTVERLAYQHMLPPGLEEIHGTEQFFGFIEEFMTEVPSYQDSLSNMIADGDNIHICTPYVDCGKVTATVKAHGRAKKVEIMKFRRRKHHQKRTGHRQHYTDIEITGIKA